MVNHLPLPDAEALAHSARVAEHIRVAIDEAGGWISFADYMKLALYAPALGYYTAGAIKLGRSGDFTTAPEMTPLFGQALARQVDAILASTANREIVELGAGTGRLAVSLIAGLEAEGSSCSRYLIIEPSPDLRERQRAWIAKQAPDYVPLIEWIDTLPTHINGAVIANELLDAIPAHVLCKRDNAWLERGVVIATEASPPCFGLAWGERPASEFLSLIAQPRFPNIDGYMSETNPAAEALVTDLGKRLVAGALLFIDYGFPEREYYHPQRSAGTLMCHYRHRAHDNPFFYPGLCDITAHVDFSAIARAGQRAGLVLAGYTAQAPFLLGCGVLDALQGTGGPETLPYIKAATQVQTMLSPAEMGELFKVLALTRSPGIQWPGFGVSDRRHRL